MLDRMRRSELGRSATKCFFYFVIHDHCTKLVGEARPSGGRVILMFFHSLGSWIFHSSGSQIFSLVGLSSISFLGLSDFSLLRLSDFFTSRPWTLGLGLFILEPLVLVSVSDFGFAPWIFSLELFPQSCLSWDFSLEFFP
jgi:hypothetical protein